MVLNAVFTRLQTFFVRGDPWDLKKQRVRRIPTDPTTAAHWKRQRLEEADGGVIVLPCLHASQLSNVRKKERSSKECQVKKGTQGSILLFIRRCSGWEGGASELLLKWLNLAGAILKRICRAGRCSSSLGKIFTHV